ncbi:MAG: OmpH family outer membrane protein [Paramuribaculum sp.]|nr:OmpH family outer membrane protein [Paramuribaculum sp.]MDE6039011.1 OmpH family outer membrane protein [Paramuribaculum sp.]MDE6050560.1 OmpH family outer membrane protein [Paramuribaculum sp.]
MIKKLILAILVALPTMAMAQKFGMVDTQSLIQALPEVKEVQTQLEASVKKYSDEENNLHAEREKKIKEFQEMDQNTPDAIKQRRVEEIQGLEQKIAEFRQTAQQDLQRQQEQLMAPIQQKIMTAIQSVGTEGGYTMIFENGISLFTGKDVVDVTPQVKTKLGVK